MISEKIVQIIPAVGWKAHFIIASEDPSTIDHSWSQDVMCFGLVERIATSKRFALTNRMGDGGYSMDSARDGEGFVALEGPSGLPRFVSSYAADARLFMTT